MKYIKIRLTLCALFAFSSLFLATAQTSADNEAVSSNNDGNSLVQVAYRKVPQSDLLGGVSVVDMENLMKKNYNTYSLDNMQGYVGGWTGNSLWGMGSDYLVLIDGVPRDANNVDPTEIDQITFLKGASAIVLYGSRAAKGVVLITTKRGKAGPNKVDVRVNTGMFVSKRYPTYLGSAEYMSLYNEARTNDGLTPLYSANDIYNYSTGQNPYRYPNLDFYSSDFLKKAYNKTEAVAEISGGNNRARYYTNIGYYTQDDLFKIGQGKNNNINRLNVRGNIDFAINDLIKTYVNANATFYNTRSAKGDYWGAASTFRPNRLSPLVPLSFIDKNDVNNLALINSSLNIVDGKYFLGGTQADPTNVFADMYAAGYSQWTSRQFQFDTGLDFDLKGVLKGLSFKGMFAVDYATSYTLSYDNSYAVFAPTWAAYNGTDVINTITKYNDDKKSGNQNASNSADRQTIAFSAQFDYKTKINDVHNISATLLAAGFQQTQSGTYHKPSNANIGLQVSYDYQKKYFADLGIAGVHSAKLGSGNRDALSPSMTLGWNVKKENFLANSPVVNDLTLSASASILNSDLDIANYYLYQGNVTQADGAYWGWYDGASEKSTNVRRVDSPNLTFVKRKEFSVNMKAALLNKLITVDASYFTNSMKGLIVQPSTQYPSYFIIGYPQTSFAPYANFNNDGRNGFDVKLNINKKIGKLDCSLGLIATYYMAKATKRDENYLNAYQNRAGKPLDAIWGLKALGFYTKDEVTAIDGTAAHPRPTFGNVQAGDIKYQDMNQDGVIDEKDQVNLGRGGYSGAPLVTGVNLTMKYGNFTLFALGTGGFGAKAIKGGTYYWVYGEGKYSDVVRGRWTESTAATATYPRLTTGSGTNNFQNSDFWLYSTDRFDLAKVQLTYDVPKALLQKFFIHEISAYISGSNLLTIAKERKILETNVTSAPQTRFYNLGVKVAF
ncbi:SusC/RagA family TonB-linked outer membrane protein [Paludibacter jiangxiensis]|uniref:TonB-linked outer membrane protein, SusC/RagA family n=1 Tax=Paludibacter jiangxiensis TaxID=681398 RepID=A0A171A2T7_9BACT|nr:SusC/RagA family TonB-linked outer membrane protein [Paludibacter jiangxiensis]GAT63241.1 TonB-linked outer membrane protein, SusC/RagA family [Paludibacter jiangxiensis]